MRREGAWNSPISARSFPKIEKVNIFSFCSGIRWAPSTPSALGLCVGCYCPAQEILLVGRALDLEPGVKALSLAVVWIKYWGKECGEPW